MRNSAEELVSRFRAAGADACLGSTADSLWIEDSNHQLLLLPQNARALLTSDERRELRRKTSRTWFASYVLAAPAAKPNAFHYVARTYGIDQLSSNTRSKTRRGLKRFGVGMVDAETIVRGGYTAAADSRERNDFARPSESDFHKGIRSLSAKGHQFWAALGPGDEVAAFCAVLSASSWATIPINRSANHYLRDYPNNALFHEILNYYLTNESVHSVSYGFSSMQNETNMEMDDLHRFKLSIGFEAIPIRRVLESLRVQGSMLARAAMHIPKVSRLLRLKSPRIRKLEQLAAFLPPEVRIESDV